MSVVELVPAVPRVTTEGSLELAGPAYELAERIARTEFVPTSMRGKPEAVLAAILTGYELGIGPMQSLARINVIDGRPALSSELMRGLVLAAGHDLWVAESTNTRCTVGAKRRGSDREQKFTWTLDDAKRAGLDGRQNWRKYPRAMLLARATSEAIRAAFPDVVAGVSYSVEELTDGDILDPDDITVVVGGGEGGKPKRARARRAATTSVVPATPPPATTPPRELPPLPGEDLSGLPGSPPSDGGGDDHPSPPPDDDQGPVLPPANAIAAWCAATCKQLHPDYGTARIDDWRHLFLQAFSDGAYSSSRAVPTDGDTIVRLRLVLARLAKGELLLDTADPPRLVNPRYGWPTSDPAGAHVRHPSVAGLPGMENLQRLTVAQLAERLRTLGIVPEGNKAHLIELLEGAE